MCACTTRWWTTQKRFEMELPFHRLLCESIYIQYIIDDLVPHDLDLLFYDKILKAVILGMFICDYLANEDTSMVHIGNKWEVIYGLSTGIFIFDLCSF